MKTKVTKLIDGVEKTITINPKYAGTSKKPKTIRSSARKWIA